MRRWRGRGSTLRPGPWSGEVGEPASWILAIAALSVALGGARVLSPSFYTSPVFAGILLGFTIHELAHRQVARRYGAWSEFAASTTGLIVTLASAALPIKILAPGYVRIAGWGPLSQEGILYSAAAGPAANIALALLSLLLSLAGPAHTWAWYLRGIAAVNAYLAAFNLLPLPPLDGAKIAKRDAMLWAVLMALALAAYIAST
ncbi:M50 family metallopeptidase [Stetteria hydrogenophila]